jgi:hypothetical protein
MPRLSQAERLQSIYHFLNDAHRWSIKDFIQSMATAQSVPYAHTAKTRIKALRKDVVEQPEVWELFKDDDELIPTMLAEWISSSIRKELYTRSNPRPIRRYSFA